MKIRVRAELIPTAVEMQGKEHSPSGTLFIEVGEERFGGYDYPVEVLARWIENAMRLNLPESEVVNSFMDSSRTFSMRRSAGTDNVTIRLCDASGRLVGEYTVSYKRSLAELRGAAKSLLQEIKKRGLNVGGYEDDLRDRLTHLERLEASIKAGGLT